MGDVNERIRERAYRLWIEEGQPEGRADRHWDEARRLVEEEGQETAGTADIETIAADPAAEVGAATAAASRSGRGRRKAAG